ncbi:hypothetical protein OAO63_02895 [Nitrosopumilus sp.]|nr:hypothetical protein [Nitrosopumilus sp.]
MTYQTAYKLLVAAYKSAKGVMPQGIDMLKLKMKARQKVIDAKKIIEVNFDKGNNWMKAKPQSTKVKGKAAETEAEMIVRMNRQNKESVARLKEKKEKSLGEKLKDYDGDPDAMAGGGKVKKPFKSKVVDFLGGPAVVGAELGLSGLLEVYNILGMPLMKDGGKVKKKRKHNDNIDDEDIGEGESKERFLRVMPEVDGIPRSDGIMELAVGGMTNIGDTYDNNPTLQSQYPNKQDYLDLFAQQTTTTPQMATAYQSTGSIDPINPIKPIIPIPENSDGGGGGGPPPGGGINFDYGYTSPGGKFNLDDIGEGTVADEDYTLGMRARDAYSGIKQALTYNPFNPMFKFNIAKAALSKGKEKALDIIQAIKDKKALKDALEKAAKGYKDYGSGAATTFDTSNIDESGNYQDNLDPGQTE